MRRTLFLIFIFCIFYSGAASISSAQNKNPLDEANNFYAEKNYAEAIEIYRKLLGETSDADEKAKITYNLGMSFRLMNQFGEAQNQFQKVLAINVSNRAIKQGILNTYENYHHNAQFEIAKIQYETRDFESALKSFRDAGKKYPFKSECGSCIRDENYKITLFEAATLERLNRNKEAFDAYFKIAHPRLIEIYAVNKNLDKLVEITAKKNEPFIKEYEKKSYTRERIEYFLPTKNYTDFFKFYEYSKNGNSAALLDELRKFAASPQDNYLKDWTAKMLAANPETAVSLVAAEFKNLKTYPYVFYRTLGFAATPEAIAILKTRAEKSNGWFDAESIVASFILAGEAGKAAIKELEAKTLNQNIKLAIQKYENGELAAKNYLEMDFAPLQKSELPLEF